MKFLAYEQKAYIGILTINRPEALNALNSEVLKELTAQIADIASSDIRCLLITGAGEKAFVAGADIGEMSSMTPAEGEAFSVLGNAVMRGLETLPMPVIALVNGFALGGGFEIALSCDMRLASENASFALPEVSLGIIPGYGGVQRLARLIGAGKAAELVYTTTRIKADAALSLGIVNRVVPQAELMQEGMALAEKIASNAPLAVQAAKSVMQQSLGQPLEITHEMEKVPFGALFATQDQKNAMSAFVEKRKPEPFAGN